MYRRLVLLSAVLLLVGCQQNQAPDYVLAPTLQPPAIARQTTNTRTTVQQSQQQDPIHWPPSHPQNFGPLAGPREWAPTAPANAWKYIVIHHSDTKVGSAAAFDNYHRTVRHWDELGYHFVIGNGTGSADGLVEVGPRWPKQKWGAHAGVRLYNEYGIGICLVGNFDQTRPSPAQVRSLTQLVAYLMRNYHIAPDHVIGHREAKDGKTNCPGHYLNVAAIRSAAAQYAGMGPALIPTKDALASRELLHNAR